MSVVQDGTVVELEAFLATFVVRMVSANASPACFQESGMVTQAKFLQTLRFPGSAAFRGRVEDFRLRVAVYAMLHGYTYTSPLCVSVEPTSQGTVIVAPAGFPCSYSCILTLYHAIRGMYSLLVYNGYDAYNALRRS